jgi:hypothetical protein
VGEIFPVSIPIKVVVEHFPNPICGRGIYPYDDLCAHQGAIGTELNKVIGDEALAPMI